LKCADNAKTTAITASNAVAIVCMRRKRARLRSAGTSQLATIRGS
jgi:hypothetical protein